MKKVLTLALLFSIFNGLAFAHNGKDDDDSHSSSSAGSSSSNSVGNSNRPSKQQGESSSSSTSSSSDSSSSTSSSSSSGSSSNPGNRVKISYRTGRLQAGIKTNIPNKKVGIDSVKEAKRNRIQLEFSHEGQVIALCSLARHIDHSQAEFKLDVRLKKGQIEAKKGYCDGDVRTDGIQAVVPALVKGDSWRALVSDKAGTKVIAQGTL